ncbi:MAG: UDP-N-acetylmuramate dehydrogenase [Bacteroidales bacterium]|nr:UDP-N-acetylmuramate dehydrogenase [Bacteroidales bacterium]
MKLLENISLKPYNTFGIDVPARRMAVLEPGDDPSQLLPLVQGHYFVLGAGSDVVFTRAYDGTVVRLDDVHNATVIGDGKVRAWGGMTMDRLIEWTLQHDLYGAENLSAIPGTVGAAAVQNVGAYGVEAKDIIASVEAYDLQQGAMCSFSAEECRFAYRDSMFKHNPGRYVVLWVTFRLSSVYVPNLSYKALADVPHATAQQMRQSITDLRWSKLPRPEEHGSAGSFFKNPVVDEATYLGIKEKYPDMPEAHPTATAMYKLSAGWLIDRAGWKGHTQGGAGVWPKNALVLYNTGVCTGDEVTALAGEIVDDVRAKFGITLIPEAIMV